MYIFQAQLQGPWNTKILLPNGKYIEDPVRGSSEMHNADNFKLGMCLLCIIGSSLVSYVLQEVFGMHGNK